MPFAVYRADNRAPEQIAESGFQARVPLDPSAARQLVARALIDPNAPLNLPKAPGNTIAEYFERTRNQPTLVGLPALYDQIRKETSATTMHVSTSPNIGVGGFDHRRHQYLIEMPLDRMYAWDIDPTRRTRIVQEPREIHSLSDAHPAPDPKTGIGSSKPVLLTDSASIDNAAIIAVYSPNGDGEVAFLTGLPEEWITRTRSLEQNGPWHVMPHAGPELPPAADAAVPASASPGTTNGSAPAVAPDAGQAFGYEHPYADPANPMHALYGQALTGLGRNPLTATIGVPEKTHNAAALADAAHNAQPPLDRIDSVEPGRNGGLFAIQGSAHEPAHKYALLQSPAALPAIQSARTAAETTQPARIEAVAEQSSVSALRSMFESPQAPSAPTLGPRRY
ncbi:MULTISPECIES: XVIPCD domain-containing protein [Lysobacter]|uniref:XVIPCD domain-containing protein n=1 Tax=Lysobacter firmicutimachus TaxID=1792846 RepID=A0ABU8CZN2_9GAMM|nr:XVIPCD domain-containing protein [Lysobacter antibioticus]